MTNLDQAPKQTLEYSRNHTSVPMAVGREAVNEAGIYVYRPQESITDAFLPLKGSENPQVIKADE